MHESTVGALPEELLEELAGHEEFVRRIVRGILGPGGEGADVDDVLQDTWIRALAQPRGSIRDVRGWLARVAGNLARSERRATGRRARREHQAARPEGGGGADGDASELLASVETRQRVVAAILTLDEVHRAVVLMRYERGLSPREIAAKLGRTPATVRSQLSRAHARLRSKLDAEFGDRRWAALALPATQLAPNGAGGVAAAVAASVLVAGAGGAVLWAQGEQPGPATDHALAPTSPSMEREAPPAVLESLPAGMRQPVALAARPSGVRGVVVDQDDRPVPRALVGYRSGGATEQTWVKVDAEGRFELGLEGLGPDETIELIGGAHPRRPWIRPGPSVRARRGDEVQLRVETSAHATLEVDVRDPAFLGEFIRFQVAFSATDSPYITRATENGSVTVELPVRGPARTWEVELLRPRPGGRRLVRSVELQPGGQAELSFELFFDDRILGQIVTNQGEPIEGATVFFGRMRDATGDEPFKPFAANRVEHALTDEQGFYELIGSGPRVTVWHPEYSPETVPTEEAHRVSLNGTGRIEGRVDLPPGSEIELLPGRRAILTDGTFEFDGLPAGTYGLLLPDGRCYALAVDSYGPTSFTDEAAAAVDLRVTSGGSAPTDELEGVLIGCGEVETFAPFELAPGQTDLRLEGVLPGEHLWVAFGGSTGIVMLEGQTPVELDLGTARLTVLGPPDHTLTILPLQVAHDPVGLVMAERVARASSDGRLDFAPLPEGDYEVLDLTAETRTRVSLEPGQRLEVTLPR